MAAQCSAHPPEVPAPLESTLDVETLIGVVGQTIAGVLLVSGKASWRSTSRYQQPRGVFCGIGVCFDCIAEVNGLPDVRCCLRRALDGDVVVTQHVVRPTSAQGAS